MMNHGTTFPNDYQITAVPGRPADMALRATGDIEGVAGGDYQRIYIPAKLSEDSQYPFEPGDGIRLQVAKTTCDREVLVVTSDVLEVNQEDSEIELARSSAEVQTELSELAEES